MDYKGLLILLLFILLGCPSQKKKDVEDLTPRTYELPEMDEEELGELPEAGENDEDH